MTKKQISIIEKGIEIDPFYLVNSWEMPCKVHLVDTASQIETVDGWHLWFVKDSKEVVQTVNNEFGHDHHVLNENELANVYEYYAGIQ